MTRGEVRLIQETLGYRFANPDLLEYALTHGSISGSRGESNTYQRLEFLGDRVLGLVVADMLDQRFPEAPEGELSKRLNRLVSGETCAQVALDMNLHEVVRVGGGKPTANVLGDTCEAVLAALYRDGGLAAAEGIVRRYWGPRMESMSGPLRDAKTELQEWAHRRGHDGPVYSEIERSGPDHAPRFEIEVKVGALAAARGRGRSKREAEHEAATAILRREGVWEEGV